MRPATMRGIFRLSVRRQAKPWPKWKRNGRATAFYCRASDEKKYGCSAFRIVHHGGAEDAEGSLKNIKLCVSAVSPFRNARPETYSIPFCVHQGTMELIRQVAPALWRQDSKYSWIFGSSSSYSICVPPSLTLTSIGLSSPSATKL